MRLGDMRALAVEPGAYDAAYCLGNSFGYGDHDDSRAFLAGRGADPLRLLSPPRRR